MATIKKGDFVEIEYTGRLTEDNLIFDTTSEKIAKESRIYTPHASYGPATVCVGEHQLLKGLDEGMVGKEIGKEYVMDIAPENGFGKKSAELLKLIPAHAFEETPQIGMRVEFDGSYGIIKTITGGRIVVDFNHPLSGKNLQYTIKATKIITDDAEKVKCVISLTLNLKKELINVALGNGKATVAMMNMPEQIQKEFAKKIIQLVPSLKEVVFTEEKKQASKV